MYFFYLARRRRTPKKSLLPKAEGIFSARANGLYQKTLICIFKPCQVNKILTLLLCLFSMSLKAQTVSLVNDWNTATNKQDIPTLTSLYHTDVLFYGSNLKQQACIAGKRSIFKKYPTLTQQIPGKINKETMDNGDVKFTFDKAVTIDTSTKIYPSYLVFRHIGGTWKIVVEGDGTTDANLEKKKLIAAGAVKCDVDGDGKPEYAYLVAPELDTTKEMECLDGSCTAYIRFSNKSIPPIRITSCISGTPDNLGDLNGDGKDEIGLLPGWFTSCWAAYHVYTLKDGVWIEAVPAFSTHCNQWEADVKPIEKDPKKPGNVIIHYSEFKNDDILTKTKSIPIK